MSATAVSVTRATTHLEHVVAGRASTARAGRVAAEVRQLLSPVSHVPCMRAFLHTLLMRFIAIFAGIHWCNTRTAYEAQKSALMCSSKRPPAFLPGHCGRVHRVGVSSLGRDMPTDTRLVAVAHRAPFSLRVRWRSILHPELTWATGPPRRPTDLPTWAPTRG